MSDPEKACNYIDSKDASTDYAVMPWDDETDTFFENNAVIRRWDFIKRELQKEITSVGQLVETIKSYNVMWDGNGRQVKPQWKFSALSECINEMEEPKKSEFFRKGGILGTIVNLVLQASELIPQVKLLKSGMESCLTLHQLQIASLLACAFMCIFPKRNPEYPSINFNKLFDGADSGNSKSYIEKIKCIIHYFHRINEKQPSGNVSYHRLHISEQRFPRWDKTTAPLCKIQVDTLGRIEDQDGFLQMDFANRFVGGGVLGRGCVQEEIRFVINPELIAARLFTECLSDNEALLVIGAERYSKYVGFSDSFRFDGDYRDATAVDDMNRRKTHIIVLDALYFSHSSEQYRESKILRELKKAYVGFKPIDNSSPWPLATGNWGCGVFRGDPQLKSIIQIIAASQAGRDILYLTFGDSYLKMQIEELYALLKEKEINVGGLYRIIRLYGKNKFKNQSLFDFVREMTSKNSELVESAVSELQSPGFQINLDKCGTSSTSMLPRTHTDSVLNQDEILPDKNETDKTTSDIDSSRAVEDRNKSQSQDWTFDFGDGDCCMENASRVESESDKDVEISEMSSSPSLLSSLDVSNRRSCENEATCPDRSPGTFVRHKIQTNDFEDIKPKQKKLIQPKITDCFSKK